MPTSDYTHNTMDVIVAIAHKHTKVTPESPGGSGFRRKELASNRFSGERFTRWSSVPASSSRSRAARSGGSLPLDRAPLRKWEQRRHYCRRCSRAQQVLACRL